jgi:hypothetical protein
MAREVLTQNDIKKFNESGRAARGPSDVTVPAKKDEYLDRLLKYIPAEVVACYLSVLGRLPDDPTGSDTKVIQWVVFIGFFILTFFYLWKFLKIHKFQQLIISLVAFVVWVFAFGGPFTFLAWYRPLYGDILLPVYTLVIAIWEAEK